MPRDRQKLFRKLMPSIRTGILMKTSITLDRVTRREILGAAVGLTFAWSFPTFAATRRLTQAARIAVIADLHHDVMHDGVDRMTAFVKAVKSANPDAIIQVGDFAYPNAKNRPVIDLFRRTGADCTSSAITTRMTGTPRSRVSTCGECPNSVREQNSM
jgi:hypothetical protein